MQSEKEKLAEEMFAVHVMMSENPCNMPTSTMMALREVMRSFFGKFCVEGASREQVARYLGKDVRTISRWAEKYEDFPKSAHSGHREVTYDWMEVVKWKIRHEELFG